MKRLRSRLTYANVVSTLALFVALSGASAYAASQLADKSVGARQLRPGAVTASKIRKNAVTAPKIMSLAVKRGKIAPGAVDAARLASGAVTSEKLAAGSVSGAKLAPDSVTGDKVVESTLGRVPSAASAESATTAETANPPAFAAVDFEGNVNSSLSRDLSAGDVVRKSTGIYCVAVPDFNPRGAQVTPRGAGDGEVSAFVTIGGTGACPAPKVEVDTYKGVLTSEAFYISLYR